MQVVVIENAPVVAAAIQPDHDEHADRQGAADTGRKEIDAVDGGIPVVLKALEPIDRGKRDRQTGQRNSGSRPEPTREGPLRIAVGILAERVAPNHVRQPDPDAKEKGDAQAEKADIKIARLLQEEDILPHRLVGAGQQRLRAHPSPDQAGLEVCGYQQQRQKKQEQPFY